MSSAFFFSGCKKKTEPADPSFVVTALPQGDILFFGAYCSTDDVNLTKITIKDPLLNQYIYNAGGDLWVKDELITFPAASDKLIGTWSFIFVGNVSSDGRAFTVTSTLNVTGK